MTNLPICSLSAAASLAASSSSDSQRDETSNFDEEVASDDKRTADLCISEQQSRRRDKQIANWLACVDESHLAMMQPPIVIFRSLIVSRRGNRGLRRAENSTTHIATTCLCHDKQRQFLAHLAMRESIIVSRSGIVTRQV